MKPVIAVYDKKIGLFDQPFTVRRQGEAIREWENIVKDPNNRYGKNPEDFDLFHIANYDEVTGVITSVQPHIHLSSGVQ